MNQDNAALRPRTVLVIGGGAAGLVTLRNLMKRGQFDRVMLFERRDDVGGTWYQDVAQITTDSTSTMKKPKWKSPAYSSLIGNVLPRFLSFTQNPFPETPNHPHQPFPSLRETYNYLRDFAEPYIGQEICLNTEVLLVEELPQKKGWRVRIRDWSMHESNEVMPLEREEIWDAVVVCTGYYDNPIWPDTEGLDIARKKGFALHSKWWEGPDAYEAKRVLVIGNANSSNDIAAQLSPMAQSPVYRSMRRPTPFWFPHLPDSRIQNVGPIKKYIVQPAPDTLKESVNSNETLTAILKDGTEIKNIDAIILGTGYSPRPEFVHVIPVEDKPCSQCPVPMMSYVDPKPPQTRRVPFLHRHILYAYNPSLGFIGGTILAMAPFIMADVASTWLTLAWLGEAPYPASIEDRLAFDRTRIAKVEKMIEEAGENEEPSSSITYGFLGPGEGGEPEYANALREDIVRARPEMDGMLPVWDDEALKTMVETTAKKKYEALKWAQTHNV